MTDFEIHFRSGGGAADASQPKALKADNNKRTRFSLGMDAKRLHMMGIFLQAMKTKKIDPIEGMLAMTLSEQQVHDTRLSQSGTRDTGK